MFCQRHACRSGPTEVAHFDFQLPGASGGTVAFSGSVDMCVIRGKSMFLTHIEMYPVSLILTAYN